IVEWFGTPIFDADRAAKQIMTTDSDLISRIKQAFDDQAYLSGGELNRKNLAGKVFTVQRPVDHLNAALHPAASIAAVDWAAEQSEPYIVKEAAILFESGSHRD